MSRPHPEDPHLHLLVREKGSFPCVFGKKFSVLPSQLKRRRSPRKGERNSRVVPPFPETPRCLSPFQGNLFSRTASTFMPRNDSHYGGTCYKPVGSLVGKPRGIATDTLIHGKGSVNLLLPLGRKAHVHAPTRDDERLPWGDSRSSPRSMSALERNPQVPAPTPHKDLGPGIDGSGVPRGPRATRMDTGLS